MSYTYTQWIDFLRNFKNNTLLSVNNDNTNLDMYKNMQKVLSNDIIYQCAYTYKEKDTNYNFIELLNSSIFSCFVQINYSYTKTSSTQTSSSDFVTGTATIDIDLSNNPFNLSNYYSNSSSINKTDADDTNININITKPANTFITNLTITSNNGIFSVKNPTITSYKIFIKKDSSILFTFNVNSSGTLTLDTINNVSVKENNKLSKYILIINNELHKINNTSVTNNNGTISLNLTEFSMESIGTYTWWNNDNINICKKDNNYTTNVNTFHVFTTKGTLSEKNIFDYVNGLDNTQISGFKKYSVIPDTIDINYSTINDYLHDNILKQYVCINGSSTLTLIKNDNNILWVLIDNKTYFYNKNINDQNNYFIDKSVLNQVIFKIKFLQKYNLSEYEWEINNLDKNCITYDTAFKNISITTTENKKVELLSHNKSSTSDNGTLLYFNPCNTYKLTEKENDGILNLYEIDYNILQSNLLVKHSVSDNTIYYQSIYLSVLPYYRQIKDYGLKFKFLNQNYDVNTNNQIITSTIEYTKNFDYQLKIDNNSVQIFKFDSTQDYIQLASNYTFIKDSYSKLTELNNKNDNFTKTSLIYDRIITYSNDQKVSNTIKINTYFQSFYDDTIYQKIENYFPSTVDLYKKFKLKLVRNNSDLSKVDILLIGLDDTNIDLNNFGSKSLGQFDLDFNLGSIDSKFEFFEYYGLINNEGVSNNSSITSIFDQELIINGDITFNFFFNRKEQKKLTINIFENCYENIIYESCDDDNPFTTTDNFFTSLIDNNQNKGINDIHYSSQNNYATTEEGSEPTKKFTKTYNIPDGTPIIISNSFEHTKFSIKKEWTYNTYKLDIKNVSCTKLLDQTIEDKCIVLNNVSYKKGYENETIFDADHIHYINDLLEIIKDTEIVYSNDNVINYNLQLLYMSKNQTETISSKNYIYNVLEGIKNLDNNFVKSENNITFELADLYEGKYLNGFILDDKYYTYINKQDSITQENGITSINGYYGDLVLINECTPQTYHINYDVSNIDYFINDDSKKLSLNKNETYQVEYTYNTNNIVGVFNIGGESTKNYKPFKIGYTFKYWQIGIETANSDENTAEISNQDAMYNHGQNVFNIIGTVNGTDYILDNNYIATPVFEKNNYIVNLNVVGGHSITKFNDNYIDSNCSFEYNIDDDHFGNGGLINDLFKTKFVKERNISKTFNIDDEAYSTFTNNENVLENIGNLKSYIEFLGNTNPNTRTINIIINYKPVQSYNVIIHANNKLYAYSFDYDKQYYFNETDIFISDSSVPLSPKTNEDSSEKNKNLSLKKDGNVFIGFSDSEQVSVKYRFNEEGSITLSNLIESLKDYREIENSENITDEYIKKQNTIHLYPIYFKDIKHYSGVVFKENDNFYDSNSGMMLKYKKYGGSLRWFVDSLRTK